MNQTRKLFGTILFFTGFSNLYANPTLPADIPASAEIVHQLKYPQTNKNQLTVGYVYLYGDKFLNSSGLAIDHTYYFSEEFGLGAGASFLSSSVSKEAEDLSYSRILPVMHNPSFILDLIALYQPIYGKVLLWSYIQHFRVGFFGGAHLATETPVDISGAKLSGLSELMVGPTIGTKIFFPLSKYFSADLKGKFYLHQTNSVGEKGWRKLWAISAGIGLQW
ncbi:MAG: hypothetical protein AB7F43_10135 [Bacteriovoracia bacterium]